MDIRFIRTLVFGLVMLSMSAASFAQIGVAITIGPPPLPVYEQPICPGDGYIWTPGYWAYDYDIDDYYWVPGTWVLAPEVGFLWTPGWWGWGGGAFIFHEGYWGPRVGFYGGINYGFGYFGVGFQGGRWDGGHFFYNRSVSNINVTEIHNVYNTTVINNTTVNRVSYNGGNGGIGARPTPEEEAAANERHIAPVAAQTQHAQEARSNPQQRASVNMGKPPVAATPKPGAFKDRGVIKAREAGGPYTPPANHGGNQPRAESNPARSSTPTHVRDLAPAERAPAPSTGNPKLDQKYQQQQEKLYAQQEKERQKVAQQQEKEDQKLAKQNASEAQKQQQEQLHQQQTQKLQQRHEQQRQQLQQRQQSPRPRPPK
jgi:YXWGXW repeat-containing protein